MRADVVGGAGVQVEMSKAGESGFCEYRGPRESEAVRSRLRLFEVT
jgi:hypothetical protein